MDILLDFQPFVFTTSTAPGKYVEGLPLTSPVGNTLASHGRVFGLFTVSYPAVFPIDQIGREVFPFFEESYYKRECLSVHDHLVDSVRETQIFVEKKILEYGSADSIDFSLCVGVVWGSVLYVARFGGITGLRLYRDSTFGDLLSPDDTSGSSQVGSMSGFIQPADTLCLYNSAVSTSRFPVSLDSLKEIDSSIVYSKLALYFNDPFQPDPSCCVVGFYINAQKVPSVEEERIVFVDPEHDTAPQIEPDHEDRSFISEELAIDETLHSPVEQRLFPSEASLKGFSSKIIPSGTRSTILSVTKKISSFFTKQRLLVLGCMVLLVFVGFIFIGRDYENTFKEQKKSAVLKSELLPQAEEAYKQGLYYAELNPDRAKTYLADARKLLEQFDATSRKDTDVIKLAHDIDVAYGAVTKTYMLGSLSPYFDISTVNAQSTGTALSLTSSSLLVSDSVHNSVYRVGLEARSASALLGPSDLAGLVGAAGDDKVVYAVSKDKGIVRTQAQGGEVVSLLNGSEGWGTLSDMELFGGNLYLLDQSHAQIWKYIPEGNGFGPVRNYISADSTVDFADAVSFSVDGNVWIGKKSGDIIKLFSGKQDPFSVTGVDGDLKNVRAVYTAPETDYLYVLDDVVGRVVVVLKKDGSYFSTYSSPDFVGASDVVVDTKNKQVYVLVKQKIFKTELKEAVVEEK